MSNVENRTFARLSEEAKKAREALEKAESTPVVTPPAPDPTATPAAPAAQPTPAQEPTPPTPATPPVETQPPATPPPTASDALRAELEAKLAQAEADNAALRKKLNDQGGRFGGEIEALRRMVEQFREQLKTSQSQASAAPAKPTRMVSDQFNADFPETGKLIEEVGGKALSAAERAQKEAEEARRQVAELASERFYDALDRAMPKWEEIGQEQGFKEACARRLRGSMQTGQDIIDAAKRAGNPTPIVEFMQDYEASKTAATPPAATPSPIVTPVAATPEPKPPKVPKEALMSPTPGPSDGGKKNEPVFLKKRYDELHRKTFVTRDRSAAEEKEWDAYLRHTGTGGVLT